MVSIDLRSLSFGALAAERDDALRDYFVESESFKRLRDGTRTVVLGNRGSGKTAIFRMIAEEARAKHAIVIPLAPEDYSYELLQRTLAAEKAGAWAKHGAYSAAWKYVLYVRAMKAVTTATKGFKGGSAGKIYTYLRDKHANIDVNPIGMLISYLKRLEGLKIGSYEAAVKTRELHKLYKLEEIAPLLVDLNDVAGQRKVLILVDELDRGWDGSEDAIAFVAGLFQAAVSVNTTTPNIRVLISLRKELYDNIPALYEDAQKVRDLIETLEWDEAHLLELIAKRIRHSVPEARNKQVEDSWNTVFAGTLDYRNARSFNYMVDRTLYRPREIIQLCTEARSVAIDRNIDPPLNYNVISEAEHKYSEERLKDIAAEYRFQYPGLLSVFETFRGRPYNLSHDELGLHLLALSTGEVPISNEARTWAEGKEPEDVIEILWRVGFVRAQAVGGVKARRRSGSSYLGAHQVSNLNLRGIGRFHVHPMFRAFLGLKESKILNEETEPSDLESSG